MSDILEWLDSPEFQAEYQRSQRRHNRAEGLTRWMRSIPVLGQLTSVFWYCILTEGVYQTCKPRWGAITFCFLNDGIRPTLWHSWYQVTHENTAPYAGIYTGKQGAPKSLAQAEEWERPAA